VNVYMDNASMRTPPVQYINGEKLYSFKEAARILNIQHSYLLSTYRFRLVKIGQKELADKYFLRLSKFKTLVRQAYIDDHIGKPTRPTAEYVPTENATVLGYHKYYLQVLHYHAKKRGDFETFKKFGNRLYVKKSFIDERLKTEKIRQQVRDLVYEVIEKYDDSYYKLALEISKTGLFKSTNPLNLASTIEGGTYMQNPQRWLQALQIIKEEA
jgi:hypothetical protein